VIVQFETTFFTIHRRERAKHQETAKKEKERGKKIPFRICVRSNNVLYSPKIGVFFQKINQMPHTFTAWFSLTIKKMPTANPFFLLR